ncbi:MAG: molecular chaperone HtpG [Planctomycetota bacterium]
MTDAASAAPEEHAFQAEVQKVLDIVINSLYSHREVFLRELVSNAADALDKLRFRALTEHDLLADPGELEIRLVPDEDAGTLAIRDNGCGMSRDEMIANLGTIARSGSAEFAAKARESKKEGEAGADLIGQFGVGFYSAFLVADEVTVTSRAAGADEAWRWRSRADGRFTVESAAMAGRGTEVLLHLRKDQREFLDESRIRFLVRRYSDYVEHPIVLRTEKEEGEGPAFERINEGAALWKRPKADITDEQYEAFYRHLTHDWEAPAARTHFTIEGGQTFTGLLFVPKRPPFDLYDRDRRRGVRLYTKRVFIMDECEELVPEWLRFLRGVVDSDDLPLNVSREMLQESKATRSIRKSLVKKTLDMLESLAKDDAEAYAAFWETFGAVLKEGLHYEPDHKDRLAKLMRYASSKEELTSLADYVARMPEDQKAIYYAMGPSRNAVEGSPHTEAIVQRGYEVLFMTDPVDEWAVHGLGEFEGKALVSAMKADLDLADDSEEAKEKASEAEKTYGSLIEKVQAALSDQLESVRISRRLTDSPACLVVPEGGAHAHIERMLRQQNADMPAQKRILEINPDHSVVKGLQRLVKEGSSEADAWIYLLYDQALLAEGSPIPDPPAFARRMAKLMGKALETD